MKTLHNKLSEEVPEYRKWHSNAYSSIIHLCLLIVFATLFAQSLLSALGGIPGNSLTASVLRDANGRPEKAGRVLDYTGDTILIKFKKTTGSEKRVAILSEKKLKIKAKISGIDVDILTVDPDDTPEEVVQALRAKYGDAIEFAEVDVVAEPSLIPNDPSYPAEWSKSITGTPAAWDITTGASSVIVGIADTGVDCTHPDISANCVSGWNFYDNNADTSDVHGHGTHVAGVVASIGNNGRNTAGSAWNVKVMPLRISDPTGLAYGSTIASAITYAADRGVKVINNSYAVAGKSSAMQSAATYLANKGGILVTSAGNYGTDTGITFNDPNYLVVSATDGSDNLYSWSSYGTDVDVSAPGCSTVISRNGGGDVGFCGTSNASPEVAGLVALMYSVNPSLNNQSARDALFSTSLDLGALGWDPKFGWGRIRADLAVKAASSGGVTTPPPSTSDTSAPSVPNGVSFGAASATTVSVQWNSSTDNVGVTGYNLYRNGTKIWNGATTGFSDSSVLAGTAYSYSVSAYDAAGNVSAQSAAVSVTTPVAPLEIVTFSVSAKTATTATITWTTNQPTTGVVQFGNRSNNLSNQVATNDGNVTSHSVTLTNLNRKTTYYYSISSSSDSATATTKVSSFRTSPK